MNENTFNSEESPPAGSFDPEKAKRVRAQAQDAFLAKYRNIERITWMYLVGCLVAAWWCVLNFLSADDMRSWIVWSVFFVLVFETTVLIKLWYWVVNSKLAVVREIKLLRMDLALNKSSEAVLEEIGRVESPTRVPGVSKGERVAWFATIIAIGAVIGAEVGRHGDRHFRASGQMSSDRSVILAADGAAQVTTTYELANTTWRTLKEFTIYSGGSIPETVWIPAEESSWTDGQQRKLAVRREPDPNGPNHRDVIQLPQPVSPGQRFKIGNTFDWKATRENELWVLKLDQNWGYRRNVYQDTVILPPGAELVSAEPASASQEQRDGKTVLRFAGERSANGKWVYAVKYRLPSN